MLKFVKFMPIKYISGIVKREVIHVTIGEARQAYAAKMQALNEQRKALYEQKKALEDGKIEMTDEEISALGKAIDRVEFNRDRTSEGLDGLNNRRTFLQYAESTKRSGEAAAKTASDYSKCLEVARRIARGDKVPPYDEKKLMEFSSVMYQTSKTMAAIAQNEKVKKHKSLWGNEDDNKPQRSVDEVVDNMESGVSMSDISMDIE